MFHNAGLAKDYMYILIILFHCALIIPAVTTECLEQDSLRLMLIQDNCFSVRFRHLGRIKSSSVTAVSALILEDTVLR